MVRIFLAVARAGHLGGVAWHSCYPHMPRETGAGQGSTGPPVFEADDADDNDPKRGGQKKRLKLSPAGLRPENQQDQKPT